MNDSLGFIAVGLLTLLGTAITARAARQTHAVTVDVRIFEALQEDVVRLQDRVESLRVALYRAEDETDSERRRRRAMESQLDSLRDVVDSMVHKMTVAGVDPDPVAVAALNCPRAPARSEPDSGLPP